jgi:hypothetical protein
MLQLPARQGAVLLLHPVLPVIHLVVVSLYLPIVQIPVLARCANTDVVITATIIALIITNAHNLSMTLLYSNNY